MSFETLKEAVDHCYDFNGPMDWGNPIAVVVWDGGWDAYGLVYSSDPIPENAIFAVETHNGKIILDKRSSKQIAECESD